MKKTASYGSWSSVISAEMIAGESIRLGDIAVDGSDIYWVERRPAEKGRHTVMRRNTAGEDREMTPAPIDVRARVNEYGGGAFRVCDGKLFYLNGRDRQIYCVEKETVARQLTREEQKNFCDFDLDNHRGRLLLVQEDLAAEGKYPPAEIAALPLDGDGKTQTLLAGADFYSNPRISPDGRQLAWLEWSHPHLPWDETRLFVADLDDKGNILKKVQINQQPASVFQPQWSADGGLFYVSDQSGWWNIYCWQDQQSRQLFEMQADFGLPQWVYGMSTFGLLPSGEIAAIYAAGGIWHLATIDPASGDLNSLELPFSYYNQLRCGDGFVVCEAAGPELLPAIVRIDLRDGSWQTIRRSGKVALDSGDISIARSITFSAPETPRVQAFYYAPANSQFQGPADEKPPLIVIGHSGPTAATDNGLNLKIQYWTSRGFAVLDVNYRGSTGFGREFRNLLQHAWGVADVEDCLNGARHLAARGLVDPDKMIIRGGSAGGYTVLCALTFHDVFKVGASYYGIGDLEALSADTHKFEAFYNDWLIGPYPESKALFRDRSPLHHAEKLANPVIFFQGLKDPVVLPAQSEAMVTTLRQKGIPVAYVVFEEEGHGFRNGANIKMALESELYFYSRILNFNCADALPAIPIDNL